MKVLGIISVILGAAALWFVKNDAGTSSQKPAANRLAKEKSASKVKQQIAGTPIRCRPDETTLFQIDYYSRGELKGLKFSPQAEPVEAKTQLNFTGQLQLLCRKFANEQQIWLVRLQLNDFHEENLGEFSYNREEIEWPFEVVWHTRFGAEKLAVHPDIKRPNKFVIADIMNHLSLAWLRSPTQLKAWTATQTLNAGAREFQYKIGDKTSPLTVSKTFKRPDENYLAEYIIENGQLLKFSMKYDQMQKMATGAVLNNAAKLQLQFSKRLQKPFKQQSLKLAAAEPLKNLGDRETISNIYASELGELTANDLLNQIGELDHKEKITEYYKKYKSLFFLQKESVELFLAPLLSLPPDSEKYQVLALAMIKAGHPEIQQFLIDKVIRSPGIENEKIITTLGLMSMLTTPTPATVRQIKKLAQSHQHADVRNSGWLSASNMARKITDQTVKNEVMTDLHQKSQRDRNASERLETIHAAGNLGHAELVKLVLAGLEAPELTTKQAALLSLRFMDSELAQPVLMRYMQDDQDESLAMTAFETASYQELTPELLRHLTMLSENARKEQLRLAALQLLKQKYDAAPAVISKALDQAARYDASLRVRQFAHSLSLSL